MTVVSRRKPVAEMTLDLADPLAVLAAFCRDLASLNKFSAVTADLMGLIAQTLDARSAGLFMVDEESGALVCSARHGPAEWLEREAQLADGVLARCLRGGALEFGDRPGPRKGHLAGSSLLCAPLIAGDQRLGVIAAADRGRGDFRAADGDFLQAAATMLALAASNAHLRQAMMRQEGIRRDLDLAAEIQRSLLPKSDPARFPVLGLNLPIRRVSGDFFDFFWLDQDRIAFALGDVSGKGINAALLMAKTAGLFRCLAKRHDDPAAVLEVINHELWETASRGMFVTMVGGIYDSPTGRVVFANAGHEPPLLRATDRDYQAFPAKQPPLGILPALDLASQEIDLAGGEFYIFSDGLTEYRYGDREALGVEGLIQLLESMAELPLEERLRTLLHDLDQEGWEVRDDLTVLAIDDAWVRRHD